MVRAIYDAREQIAWLIVEGRNITPLVRLQAALRQEQERSLQLINSSVDGIVAFDANGCCTLTEPQTAKEMLGIANNNIERLVRLVNDILALNRLESGQVKLKKQWCDEAALVQQAFSNVQNLAHSNQITLQSSVSEIQIWADPDWLVQVLVNLINNAVKFSPAGTTVSVSTQTQTQQVFFRVTDQGRGIPTEKLETIFGRFQQVDASDSRQNGGTGLGLAICRLIVQLHDGRIWAESELGQGSTFGFTLPIPQRSHP